MEMSESKIGISESKTNITEAWSKGDDYPGNDQGDLPIAGIHIGAHGNAVECYSVKAADAAAIRDHILDCVARCAQMDAAKAMMKTLAERCGNIHPELDT
jgi:hypothetical protein